MYQPLDYSLLRRVYGNDLADALEYLGVTRVLDTNVWSAQNNGKIPAVDSIFVYGGGSMINRDLRYGDIATYNGNLIQIGHIAVPYGREYYEAKYGRSLL